MALEIVADHQKLHLITISVLAPRPTVVSYFQQETICSKQGMGRNLASSIRGRRPGLHSTPVGRGLASEEDFTRQDRSRRRVGPSCPDHWPPLAIIHVLYPSIKKFAPSEAVKSIDAATLSINLPLKHFQNSRRKVPRPGSCPTPRLPRSAKQKYCCVNSIG